MEIGFFAAHEQHDPSTLLEHVAMAEAAGFDSVWTSDHTHPWWHTDAHCGAAWPWLGAALERTRSVRLGTGVTPPISRYHPGVIAQVFATLGAMYPGRVHLALGTGEAMNEVPLGYEWPEYGDRRRRLVDACEIISRLWDGGFQDYDGEYWTIDGLRLYTLPDRRVPLYVAGNGPQSASVAGRYADGFLTVRDVETFEGKLRPSIESAAADAGRRATDIRFVRQLGVSYAPSYDDALESAGFWRGPRAIGFHQDIADPREIERRGRELPVESMADAWLVTSDPADIRTTLADAEAAGFDEVEILSASPDQSAFIRMMEAEGLTES